MKRVRIPIYSLMIIPVLVAVALFFVYPLVRVFYLGFFRASPVYGTKFVGFGNYIQIFADRAFILTIVRNLVYVGVVVGANFLIGMGFALLTYKEVRGVKILRIILIVPMLFIPAAAAITWALLYDEEIGLINHFLKFIGLGSRMWLASGKTGFPAVMITDVWAWTPFVYLILLAGLQSLPQEPFEAAEIDGASSLQKFCYVTLPMMKPAVTVAIIMKSLDTFRTFVYMWIMTRGGPGDSTQVLSTLIFAKAFRHFRYGIGSSMGVITVLLAFVLAFTLIIAFREKVTR